MRRYLLSSAAAHFSLLLFFFLISLFYRPSGPVYMIDGFDYVGGGGNGKAAGAGPRPEQMGQVVPQPVKAPLPAKPAPVQKPQAAEETWRVKNAKPEKTTETKTPESPVERGEKSQKEQSNIIRRGVDNKTTAGDGTYDFGPSEGGRGKGLGIGFGPGDGGGFGGFSSYLKILRQRLWSEWTQSAVYGSNQVCIVGLTVSRNGDISEIKVEKPSGNAFYDTVALRAARNSSPLPPLPAEFPKSEQRFRIQFRLLE